VRFVADENIDRPIVDALRRRGYVVHYIQEMEPGITDEQVIQCANDQNALLLTSDRDFGEIVFRQGRPVKGVILVRVAGLSVERKIKILLESIEKHRDNLHGNFTVVTPDIVRTRTAKYLGELS
jgi:predicted nuclease of predicted toxin-antitoxin system